ncbi:hypothetical protein SAMN05216304_1192 [Bosea sp. OK403]|uniref:hypothetical protein n=1 Tax=Bosea sp. OK403 TaxID=1855286 RepID=UPI0008F2C353|nr:hypothetical protein [Bosea sp. OK403]SFJ91917.1 hypothetical protein SAMN05216304_1192 [Bosea sp. OK403]
MLDREMLEELVAEARLAPSVHNIQPTRWQRDADTLLVLADETRRLPAADPSGHDVRLSHGAAIEGMSIALSRRGLRIPRIEIAAGPGVVARLSVETGGTPDPLAAAVATRMSWRGAFQPPDHATQGRLESLDSERDDLIVISQRDAVTAIADLGDRAAYHALCDGAQREELLHWMRLRPGDAGHGRDGLDAEALALGRIEALGAAWVLGPLFPLLRRIGLAAPLTSDRAKTASGAIALFHRPAREDPLETGQAFYRAWLTMEKLRLAACPVSVLADWPEANRMLVAQHAVPAGRRLVNVFRLGVAVGAPSMRHVRLPVHELIIEAGSMG